MNHINPQQFDQHAAIHRRQLVDDLQGARRRPSRTFGPTFELESSPAPPPARRRRRRSAAIAAAVAALFGACGADEATPTVDGMAEGPAAAAPAAGNAPDPAHTPTRGDAKDHPGYGPKVDAPMRSHTPTRGDAKDHPGYGPARDAARAAVERYCSTHVATEAAVTAEDPAAIEGAFASLRAAALPDNAAIVETLLTEAAAFMAAGSILSPEFEAAYGELVGWIDVNCGFASLDVVATEYAFGGIPADVKGGPTVIDMVNAGAEGHELVLIRRNDGVTESFDDIFALPEAEAMARAAIVGSTMTMPDGTGHAVVDLTAGDYLAICFLPVGATVDVMHDMATNGTPPGGPPHFVEGMQQEFRVVDDDADTRRGRGPRGGGRGMPLPV